MIKGKMIAALLLLVLVDAETHLYFHWVIRDIRASLLLTYVCLKVKVAQSCSTLCNSMYYIVHGILQARILEWVAFPFSRGSSQPRDRTQVSHSVGRLFTS